MKANTQLARAQRMYPVSFEPRARISEPTEAQHALVKMIMDAAKESRIIDREMILKVYVDEILDGQKFDRMVYDQTTMTHKAKRVDGMHPAVRTEMLARSLNWFKYNLSACVFRGMLIVVPNLSNLFTK